MSKRFFTCCNKVAVIGAGTMGPGIARVFAKGGYHVNIWEPDDNKRIIAKEHMRSVLYQSDDVFNRIHFTESLRMSLENVQLIIETIPEKEDVKRTFYQEIVDLVPENALIASNTSALNIFDIVPEQLLPQQYITHWYNPADIVPLVEVIKSEQASQEDTDLLMEILKGCGKAPVQMKKFIRGYIVNRILQIINREVFYLLDNGYCTAEDIDYAARMSFIPRAMVLGICKKIDFGGVDTTIHNFRNHSYQLPPEVELPETLQKMDESKAYGIKTGKGFYDYEGLDIEALLEKRDAQLVEAYNLAMQFIEDPV